MCVEAYAAGLLDGEGCISINIIPPHQLTVSFSMTERESLGILAEEWGGNIFHLKRPTANQRQVYQWSIPGSYALKFLDEISLYLQIKRKQAVIAAKYPLYGKGKGKIPQALLEIRNQLRLELIQARGEK